MAKNLIMSPRLMICAFTESQSMGERFTRPEWPLHITVIPWFNLRTSGAEFDQELRESVANNEPFTARVVSQSYTRYLPTRRVSLLEAEKWQELHESLLEVVAQYAGIVATKVYIGGYYRPHVTFQKHGHLNVGDEFACSSLYVVEKQGRYREVVNQLEIGNHEATT